MKSDRGCQDELVLGVPHLSPFQYFSCSFFFFSFFFFSCSKKFLSMPEQSHLAEPASLCRSSRYLAQCLLDFTKGSCTFLPSHTCVTQESFNFFKAGSTSAAARTRVRRECDRKKKEVAPPSTGGTVERSSSAWVWKGTWVRERNTQSEKQRALRMLVFLNTCSSQSLQSRKGSWLQVLGLAVPMGAELSPCS